MLYMNIDRLHIAMNIGRGEGIKMHDPVQHHTAVLKEEGVSNLSKLK